MGQCAYLMLGSCNPQQALFNAPSTRGVYPMFLFPPLPEFKVEGVQGFVATLNELMPTSAMKQRPPLKGSVCR